MDWKQTPLEEAISLIEQHKPKEGSTDGNETDTDYTDTE